MSRHGPKWHAASNAVVETQVIAVKHKLFFVEMQLNFHMLFNKSNMYFMLRCN